MYSSVMTMCLACRNHWRVGTLQESAKLAAIMAVCTAVIVYPGAGLQVVDKLMQDNAVHVVHVFVVLLAAILANTNIGSGI